MKTSDVNAGEVVRYENKIWKVLEKEISGHGKAARTYKVKLKDLSNGTIYDPVLKPDTELETLYAASVTMEYLYKDHEFYVFMNTENYEESRFSQEAIGKKAVLLKENSKIQALVVEGNALSIEFPEKVTLRVTAVPDGVKAGNKEATLENGLQVLVPHFVNTGDQVVINTEDFSYRERVTLKSMDSGGVVPGTGGKEKAE